MKGQTTVILRIALAQAKSIYREIEIEESKSLYRLAAAIVQAFGFDFDHAFGFYSGLTPSKMHRQLPKYELFADMGEAEPDVLGVKKTKISQAFPKIGHTLLFLFDYGDEWHFRVTLKKTAAKVANVRYPRIVAKHGDAPPQYPDPDELGEDEPTSAINLPTGEKIKIAR